MINVCVPVLKRYDLLRELLLSLKGSSVQPDAVHLIDNGRNVTGLHQATDGTLPLHLFHYMIPPKQMGVAESWNWFIQNVPEDRVICNDDITFAADSLKKLTASPADLVWAKGCGFSCFVIRDSCVRKLGLFDEEISPGYGYYEDEDYLQRLDGRGTREPSAAAREADCGIRHLHSSTLKAASHEELMEHHRKFKIAQNNYMRKWGLELVNGDIVPKTGVTA